MSLCPPSPCHCYCKPPLIRLEQAVAYPRLVRSLPLLVGCCLFICHRQAEKQLSCMLSSCIAACHAPPPPLPLASKHAPIASAASPLPLPSQRATNRTMHPPPLPLLHAINSTAYPPTCSFAFAARAHQLPGIPPATAFAIVACAH